MCLYFLVLACLFSEFMSVFLYILFSFVLFFVVVALFAYISDISAKMLSTYMPSGTVIQVLHGCRQLVS